MTSHTFSQRPEPARSATWPSQNHTSISADAQAFKDDLEQHPERHFLSPMTAEEYYGWNSDSDDGDEDDGGGEWVAGIMDFSLFTADRKRAMETGQPLDGKWDSFVSNQAEAFERSVERVRGSGSEDVPALTPDASPELRDDLEDDSEGEVDGGRMVMPQIRVPDYLTIEVKPAGADGAGLAILGPHDDLPLSLGFARKKRVQRPGLRHARTMSGRKHVWRRPGEDIFTVGEDLDAEEEAEREEQQNELRLVASTGALELGAE